MTATRAKVQVSGPDEFLAPTSMEHAMHLENRTQILAGFGGEIMEAAEKFLHRRAERG